MSPRNKFDNTISNYLSSQSTIEDISKRVEKNLNTKSSLIKALLSFGAAVIASIGGDYILRVGKKIEAIADTLIDCLTELQNSEGNTVDGYKLGADLRALHSEGCFISKVSYVLLVFFAICGLIFLANAFWPFLQKYYETKLSFRQYRDKNIMPNSALRKWREKRREEHK